jgi:hypothetical protein
MHPPLAFTEQERTDVARHILSNLDDKRQYVVGHALLPSRKLG